MRRKCIRQLSIGLKKVYKVGKSMIMLIQVSNSNNITLYTTSKKRSSITWNVMKLPRISSNCYRVLMRMNAYPQSFLNSRRSAETIMERE
jgi:hypothetical protein